MRAARYYGPGDVRVEDVPEPKVKQGQVKLKLAWYVVSPRSASSMLRANAISRTGAAVSR